MVGVSRVTGSWSESALPILPLLVLAEYTSCTGRLGCGEMDIPAPPRPCDMFARRAEEDELRRPSSARPCGTAAILLRYLFLIFSMFDIEVVEALRSL